MYFDGVVVVSPFDIIATLPHRFASSQNNGPLGRL